MFSRIDTLIVRVRDVSRAKQWYQQTLELSPVYEDEAERLVVVATPEGSSLTLWELKEGQSLAPESSEGSYPIFSVSDAPAAHRTLQERGAAPGPLSRGEGVCFFQFRDPDGNRLEACQVLS